MPPDEVVAEVHDEVVVAEEVPAMSTRARGRAGRPGDVRHRDPHALPSPTAAADLVAVSPTMMPMSVTRVADRLEAVEQHGLVGDRYELLRGRVRDRAQAGAGAAGEDECLHALIEDRDGWVVPPSTTRLGGFLRPTPDAAQRRAEDELLLRRADLVGRADDVDRLAVGVVEDGLIHSPHMSRSGPNAAITLCTAGQMSACGYGLRESSVSDVSLTATFS